jgi:transcription antitermination factor NusG
MNEPESKCVLENPVAMCENGEPVGVLNSNELPAIQPSEPWNGGFPQWFALAVKPRFDKAVARALEGKGYETFVPLYTKYHKYGARSKNFELPLFPGYVCCRFDIQIRLPILTTPGVIQVLGAGSMPIPLSDLEIYSLQTAIKARLPVQPFPFLDVGQKVRINSGVLSGMEGIVLRSKPSLRLVLSLTLLQRSVLVEVDRNQVSAKEALDWPNVAV